MIEIKKELINDIVKETVKAQVALGLADKKDKIFEYVIDTVVNQRVNGDGKPTTDSYYKETMIEYSFRQMVNEAAREAIKEYTEGHKKEIVEKLKKSIAKNPNNFVNMILNGLDTSLQSIWNFKLSIEPRKKD